MPITPYTRWAYLDPGRTFRVKLRWYPAPPGAKAFPGYHLFASGDFADHPPNRPWPGPGEIKESKRRFVPGVGPMFQYTGQGPPVGDPEWYVFGVPLDAIQAALLNPPPPPPGFPAADHGPPWVRLDCPRIQCWPNTANPPPAGKVGPLGVRVGLHAKLSRHQRCEAVTLGVRAGLSSKTAAWPLALPVRLGVRAGQRGRLSLCCRSERVVLGVRAGLLSSASPCCVPLAVSLGVRAGMGHFFSPCCFWEDVGGGVLAGLTASQTYDPPPGCFVPGSCPSPAGHPRLLASATPVSDCACMAGWSEVMGWDSLSNLPFGSWHGGPPAGGPVNTPCFGGTCNLVVGVSCQGGVWELVSWEEGAALPIAADSASWDGTALTVTWLSVPMTECCVGAVKLVVTLAP